ncbi:3-deoxy-7-phosphoheptulonate synthase [Pseudonocardiaceae bacterium YIM PH 21723]|nr:3-deoxy-7-phosphoheptulonate synthase [Pseudonocardiaceae bacterium YIM PH 21723]
MAAVGGNRQVSVALPTPGELAAEVPVTSRIQELVSRSRAETRAVLDGADDRLLVVVGPCSVHDERATLEYAERLAGLQAELDRDLLVVMRVYLEKPRTIGGWPGLLLDPNLDGSYAVADGLLRARTVLRDVAARGLPTAVEWLSPVSPAYLDDLVSWAAIGARTVESHVHRQLASGLDMPIGMKNATDGSVGVAIDAIRSAALPHGYLLVDDDGRPAAVRTSGNPDCHLVLRGGKNATNYDALSVDHAGDQLEAAGLPRRVVIDASHGNSGKDHHRQFDVLSEISQQLAHGSTDIRGVLAESFLVPGRQDLPVVPGQSITDACMGWPATAEALRTLAAAVRVRRVTMRQEPLLAGA